MKEEDFNGERESFRDFLIRMIRSGKLKAGSIKPINDAFYSQHAVEQVKRPPPEAVALFCLP